MGVERTYAEQVLIDVVMRRLVAGRHSRAVVAGQVIGCLRAGVAPQYIKAVEHMERERLLRWEEADRRKQAETIGRSVGKQGGPIASSMALSQAHLDHARSLVD